MKQICFFLLVIFHYANGQWQTSAATVNAPRKIAELAVDQNNHVWALAQTNDEDYRVFFWNGSIWNSTNAIIKNAVQQFEVFSLGLIALTAPAGYTPQTIYLLKDSNFTTFHSFASSKAVLSILEYDTHMLALENSSITHVMGPVTTSMRKLINTSNTSDWTTDITGRLWLVEKTLVGQGRQTTLFIKLKLWNPVTQTIESVYQQMGPRIFKLSQGKGPTIWSLQGESPTQLYAYQWNEKENKWNIKGTIKGFKNIDVTQDGTAIALHHNNTIYEWRE